MTPALFGRGWSRRTAPRCNANAAFDANRRAERIEMQFEWTMAEAWATDRQEDDRDTAERGGEVAADLRTGRDRLDRTARRGWPDSR